MKNFLAIVALTAGMTLTYAQQTVPKEKVEERKTADIDQKVNNVVNPNHKKYNGYKVKKKTPHGKKIVKKVNHRKGTVRIKTKQAGDVEKHVDVIQK